MSEPEINLKQLFALEKKIPPSAKTAIQASARTAIVKEKLAAEVRLLPWGPVCDIIVDKIAELVDIKLVDVLMAAWKKYQLLEKYADRSRYGPEETLLVPLAEHTVKSEHHPYLEILFREHPVGKLVFDVTLELKLQGITLKIQDATIKAIQTGSCQGQGRIKLEDTMLVEKKFEAVALPGAIDLGPGISLHELGA